MSIDAQDHLMLAPGLSIEQALLAAEVIERGEKPERPSSPVKQERVVWRRLIKNASAGPPAGTRRAAQPSPLRWRSAGL